MRLAVKKPALQAAAGIACVLSGLVFIGWLAAQGHAPPGRLMFELIKEGDVTSFPGLRLNSTSPVQLRHVRLNASNGKQVADAHVATYDDGDQVVLDWSNASTTPVLNLDQRFDEFLSVCDAVVKHAPENAVFFGWWSTLRRMKAIANVNVFIDANLSADLPGFERWDKELWATVGPRAVAKQRQVPAHAREDWQRFASALAMPFDDGLKAIAELVPKGAPAFLMLHVSDVYRLGVMFPDKIGVGFKDFSKGSGTHGVIRSAKVWLSDNSHTNYALEDIGPNSVRVYFLTDKASASSLITTLLPFNTSDPVRLETPRLVLQSGGYWIYRVTPEGSQVRVERPLCSDKR